MEESAKIDLEDLMRKYDTEARFRTLAGWQGKMVALLAERDDTPETCALLSAELRAAGPTVVAILRVRRARLTRSCSTSSGASCWPGATSTR